MKIQEISIDKIIIKENHRTSVDDTNINELMASIKQHGLQQPIGVSPMKNKKTYNLIFGQRRLIACKKLGWKTVTAAIGEDLDEKTIGLLCLTENMQRVNPSYEELGRGIEELKKMNMTIPEIAVRLGINEKKVANIAFSYCRFPKNIAIKLFSTLLEADVKKRRELSRRMLLLK